jgi:hypothetical protein
MNALFVNTTLHLDSLAEHQLDCLVFALPKAEIQPANAVPAMPDLGTTLGQSIRTFLYEHPEITGWAILDVTHTDYFDFRQRIVQLPKNGLFTSKTAKAIKRTFRIPND